jgi:hypothetical protein
MSQPVLVRGSVANWPFVLLTLTAFLFLGMGVFAGVEQEAVLAGILSAVGLCLLILSPLLRHRQKRQRMWVQDLETGFKVIDFIGERDFRDDQVLSSALVLKNNYSGGVFKSTTRQFRVWLTSPDPQPELLEMTNTIPLQESDPLADFIDRLNNRLYEQAKQDWAAGQPVLGECWALQGDRLTVKLNKAETVCTLAELTAVEVVEDHVCLWRQGQDEAFVRVPATTANAYLLNRLINEQLAQRPKQEDQPPPEGKLGRILFERKPNPSTPWLLLILAFICFGSGPVMILAGAGLAGDEGLIFLGIGVIIVGGCLILGMFYAFKQLFRCHEYGVYQRGLFIGEKSLQYIDVASFTYSATRHYHNGAYVGTHIALTFEPVPEKQGQKISYTATVQNQDAALDELRDRIGRMIAARMAQRAANGRSVAWTPNLTFHPDGLEYRPSGWLGRKEPILIPYNAISGWNLEAGYFYLWETGKKKATVQEGVDQPNFFPGYYMLELLNQISQAPAPVEVEPVEDQEV